MISGQFTWGSRDEEQHQSNAQPHFPAGANAGTFFPQHPDGETRVGVLKSSAFTVTTGQLCWIASGFGSSYLAIDIGDDGSYDSVVPAPGTDGAGPTGDLWSEQCVDTLAAIGSVARIYLVDDDVGSSSL